ncbi:tRNA pseudouridine(55) synthase TruB [Candidatus Wolfebacteria bacterium]|nr:MAG: tRNA pseudouridine(55) synthase TruB [Candidatus Wolfebacteria bacterium]
MNKTTLLIDKSTGITSFDVIRKLRKKLGIRKMGHAGTLDPLASGLMIIGVNEGTKKLTEYIGMSKVYRAEVQFGIRTDTGDITGKTIEEQECTSSDIVANYKDVLNGLVGKVLLKVPAYSAIKQKGEALYKKARRGEVVNTPTREMEIFWIENAKLSDQNSTDNCPSVAFDIKVSSGSYIRSIAEEIGNRLGIPATLSSLRRTSIGEFQISDVDMVI